MSAAQCRRSGPPSSRSSNSGTSATRPNQSLSRQFADAAAGERRSRRKRTRSTVLKNCDVTGAQLLPPSSPIASPRRLACDSGRGPLAIPQDDLETEDEASVEVANAQLRSSSPSPPHTCPFLAESGVGTCACFSPCFRTFSLCSSRRRLQAVFFNQTTGPSRSRCEKVVRVAGFQAAGAQGRLPTHVDAIRVRIAPLDCQYAHCRPPFLSQPRRRDLQGKAKHEAPILAKLHVRQGTDLCCNCAPLWIWPSH